MGNGVATYANRVPTDRIRTPSRPGLADKPTQKRRPRRITTSGRFSTDGP